MPPTSNVGNAGSLAKGRSAVGSNSISTTSQNLYTKGRLSSNNTNASSNGSANGTIASNANNEMVKLPKVNNNNSSKNI